MTLLWRMSDDKHGLLTLRLGLPPAFGNVSVVRHCAHKKYDKDKHKALQTPSVIPGSREG